MNLEYSDNGLWILVAFIVGSFLLTFGRHFKNQNHYESKKRKNQDREAEENGDQENGESYNSTAST
jgi:hypothetical protein